jgi:hypothetical protein
MRVAVRAHRRHAGLIEMGNDLLRKNRSRQAQNEKRNKAAKCDTRDSEHGLDL